MSMYVAASALPLKRASEARRGVEKRGPAHLLLPANLNAADAAASPAAPFPLRRNAMASRGVEGEIQDEHWLFQFVQPRMFPFSSGAASRIEGLQPGP
jgi:hypothetical protein